jgi:hypothetical protein
VLLVGVTHDPITPLASARKLARLMGPSAVLLTHDAYGHSSFGQISSCTLGVVGRYLLTGVTPAPGTVCAADAAPFPAPPGTRAAPATPPIPYPVRIPLPTLR